MKLFVALLLLLAVSLGKEGKELWELTEEEILSLPPFALERYRNQLRGIEEIVGGVEVSPKFKYPWTASLFSQTTRSHFCGGSLVNETWVLTAAHCSTGTQPRSVGIEVHRHDLSSSSSSEGAVVREISKIVIHPRYNRLSLDNDVALWKLSSPINDVELVPMDKDGSSSSPNTVSTVAGWGATREGGRGSSVLLEVDVPIVTNAQCNSDYNGGITDSMICAGYPQGGKDACQGDSGGPLFVNKNSRPVQVGIVSWGTGCARPGKPGVYARVSHLIDFIMDTIENE